MAELISIVYPDEFRAAEVMATLKRLQRGYLVDLEDACVVVRDKESGKIKLHQAVDLTTIGATSGALWGALIGLIFLSPLAGMAVGAAAGAIGGSLSDYGIDDGFIKNISEKMRPGTSAIFMALRNITRDKVEPELARFGGEILYTNLPKESEEALQKLLAAHRSANLSA
ncbi:MULTISPECIES: DUF1269 domain-containing protein [Methylococcus]|uniref:DUF1269 domain-containing protein n=1 Tax=Methylococcus capsulatus TaxID=414 RepID=A0ABZ2F471_METCP|nr:MULTISPECIES: DUF1269 domain-containing protein [Methylococcus]MDF9391951.1 DUF1269 domain-containing protein [Methylococcus capsulatus]